MLDGIFPKFQYFLSSSVNFWFYAFQPPWVYWASSPYVHKTYRHGCCHKISMVLKSFALAILYTYNTPRGLLNHYPTRGLKWYDLTQTLSIGHLLDTKNLGPEWRSFYFRQSVAASISLPFSCMLKTLLLFFIFSHKRKALHCLGIDCFWNNRARLFV